MKNKILNEARVIGLSIVGCSIGLAALFAVLPFLPKPVDGGGSTAGNSSIGGLRAPKVGETMFVGRGNCDAAVKAILRDPTSYERIDAQIVDMKAGEGWVARMDFRSRNGFGGLSEGTAYCVFDGRQYRALFDN